MPQPETRGRGQALELFLVSLVSLYLELLTIRWFSGEIRFFTVFRTFPLITCFVGLGLGCALGRERLFTKSLPAVLLLVATVQVAAVSGLRLWMFPSLSVYAWQDLNVQLPYVLTCIPLVLTLLAGPFALMVCLGARIGRLFERFRPLAAYSINVAGAIAGSIIFAGLSFAGWQPGALLLPALLVIAFYVHKQGIALFRVALPLAASILLSLVSVNPPYDSQYWSPYQLLTVRPLSREIGSPLIDSQAQARWSGESADQAARATLQGVIDRCLVIKTNHFIYQVAEDLRQAVVGLSRFYEPWASFFSRESRHYGLPYRLASPKELLVVGAGSGNDVASALRHGVAHVDAVELDPVIISLGKRMHPEHPYDSGRVTVICNDARNYFNTCKKRYDMVIIAGLDSQTVMGQGSSVRVDTYVHTKESFAQAARLLKDDGLLLVTFYTTYDWLADRLFQTIHEAVGYDPVALQDTTPNMPTFWQTFVVGKPVADRSLRLEAEALAPFQRRTHRLSPATRIVTDDWPYLYVTPVALDGPYWLMMLAILAVSSVAVRPALAARGVPSYWQMFFLGAAFLLLELRSVAQLSLLYGSTWLTSTVVIVGVLLIVLVANAITAVAGKWLASRQSVLYLLLLAALVGSYLAPDQAILASGAPRGLASALVTLLSLMPLCLASLIFSASFAAVGHPGRALAFNLFGAVIGGLLEYTANFTGIKSLVVVAAVLYLLSYLCSARSGRLEPATVPAAPDLGPSPLP